MDEAGIILLGLGPGSSHLLTMEAWEILTSRREIWYRTRKHPIAAEYESHHIVQSFDHLYEELDSFDKVYESIIEEVLKFGEREEGVVYAVPGHPYIAEATGPEISRRAGLEGIPVRVVEGLSFVEPTLTAIGMDIFPQTSFVDALLLADAHVPSFPTNHPALIAQLYSKQVASDVKLTLMSLYPDEFLVTLVHNAGLVDQKIETLPLYEIDRSNNIDWMTSLYVPALGDATSFEEFHELIAHLRSPEGCDWDRKQTHRSLRSDLLEEAYEVLAAIDAEDQAAVREELGDLLLLIMMHIQIGEDEGEFNFTEVIQGIHTKIVNRHPHVFGEVSLSDPDEVLLNWERIKAKERNANGLPEKSILDGVNIANPALLQAHKYQMRAARFGFDWPEVHGVWDKLFEEIEELKRANDLQSIDAEMGDLLFAAVNLARWLNVDPESALREANTRFRYRFNQIEVEARRQGRDISDLSLDEMETIWQTAKDGRN